MKKQSLLLSLMALLLVFSACQKEFSLESGSTPSQGVLQSDAGDCLPKTVVGAYEEGSAISGTTHYIEVEVNVTQAGSYVISTDTINGVFFRATGTFTNAGTVLVKLPGSGTPVASGIQNYVVTYGTSQCTVAVTTLPVGGGVPAELDLIGSPGNCSNFTLLGSYVTGVALNSSNQVELQVDVITPGTFNISTVLSNGIIFSGAGTLGTTGPTTITLTGSGTPVNTGPTNIPVTVGASTCSFSLDVVGPAVYTIDCGTSVINGTYEVGVELDGTNSVNLTVDVTTPGGYNISGTVNGMTFSVSDEFTTTGPQTVTLVGNGIPAADGTFTVQLNAGTTPCSFEIICGAPGGGASGTFSFTEGATTYTGQIVDAGFDGSVPAPAKLFYILGQTATNEVIDLEIGDVDGTIGAESYSGFATGPENVAGFYFYTAPPALDEIYLADPTITPNTITVNITSHDAVAKTMSGTFSGEAQDGSGNVKVITNGTFTLSYP